MNQALLNEYKGYIFEYLVAHNFSKRSYLGESYFLQLLNKEENLRLENYQQALFSMDALLYKQLPLLAKNTTDYYFTKHDGPLLKSVQLVSRIKNPLSNADIVLDFEHQTKKLSLKLCKDQVYVNTKSAGVKSFFSIYFKNAKKEQLKINQNIFQAFENMRFQLLDFYGHELSSKLFEQWQQEGRSILPGQVETQVHGFILEYYHQCITEIYNQLLLLLKKNPHECYKSFSQLCGLSSESNHLFCFHQGTGNYKLSRILEMNRGIIQGEIPHISAPTMGSSYFLINYSQLSLQIRVKPMRSFIVPAMKINCGIKLRHEKVI